MDEIMTRIRAFGLPEEESNEMFSLLTEDLLDIVFEDLAEKATDDELGIIENRIKESKSVEHFQSIIDEIALTVYGDDAKEEIQNIYLDLLDEFEKNVEEAKALIERANNGDVQAQELLKKAEETSDYKNIVE